MNRLTQSWLIMLSLALATAALLGMSIGIPRIAWVAIVMLASFAKGYCILLDYLELRGSGVWQSAAVTSLALLLVLLTLLATL